MSYSRDIEGQLRALEERRNLLDKKIEAKLDTITKFNQIRENSKNRLNAALDKQDAEARSRNSELMKKIMSTPLSSTLLAQRKCVIDNEEKLNEAKASYSRTMEAILPTMHRNQSMLLEEKIKQIKHEKDLSVQRRTRLSQELVYEERVRLELERQRRDLMSSLALEQQDIMQSHASAVMLAVDGAEADRLVYEQVENAGNDLRGLIANSLTRGYGTNLDDLRQQQREMRALRTMSTTEQQYGRGNSLNVDESGRQYSTRQPYVPSSASKQDRSFSQNSRGADNSSSDGNVSFDRSVMMEQKVSETPDTRYRMLVESPRPSENNITVTGAGAGAAATGTTSTAATTATANNSSTRPNLESAAPAEPMSSPRGERVAVPLIVVPVRSAPPASIVASPSTTSVNAALPPSAAAPSPRVPTTSTAAAGTTAAPASGVASLRRNNGLYVSEDEFDEEVPNTARSFGTSTAGSAKLSTTSGNAPTAAATVAATASATAASGGIARVDSVESFPSIPEEPLPSPSRPPQPTVAESVAALQKILNSTPDCLKCLKSLFSTIENRIMFINSIGTIYTFSPLNVTDVAGNSHRNKLTEFLTLLLDPASSGSAKLEQMNDNDKLLGDSVMCILEAKAPLLIPKDAFMGVMTLDKLKKEHKKLPSPGPILEMWDSMTGHLQRLVEANSTYLTALSSTFTSVLISHIAPEDKDRLNRKVSSLLQLAMIPPSSEGNRSPEPPYRANSRKLDEPTATSSAKLTNRFNEVAASTVSAAATAPVVASAPAAPLSRPLLTSKTSSKFAYDSMQLPTNAASEFDDEEFLADDSFQAPPSMRDVDELHGGSTGNKNTTSVSGSVSSSTQRGGARVVQVGGGKGRSSNNRDLDNSNVNDEFDF